MPVTFLAFDLITISGRSSSRCSLLHGSRPHLVSSLFLSEVLLLLHFLAARCILEYIFNRQTGRPFADVMSMLVRPRNRMIASGGKASPDVYLM